MPPLREPDTDVVVVGAGLAGLACALRLSTAGRDVVVVEATDGVGGRVRTDTVDGFRLDRGFQVFDTAYPEAARLLDYEALHLQPFEPGAMVWVDGAFHDVADALRQPAKALATLRAPIGSLADKLRVGLLRAQATLTPPGRLKRRPETTTVAALRARGFSEEIIERFFRPFFAGVFLERELETSSRFFDLVFRCFAVGAQVVPAGGMGAIPAQLAARLPTGSVRVGSAVQTLHDDGVTLADGTRLGARATVVAADPRAAAALLHLDAPRMNGVATVHLGAEAAPTSRAVLMLDGTGGPVSNVAPMSNAAPGYAPLGRALLSASTVDRALVAAGPAAVERVVRSELEVWYGGQVRSWETLRVDVVGDGLPAQPPPMGDFRRPVRVGPRRYVCGDWRDSASQQGALVSGRRAADAVLSDLSPTVGP